MSSFIKVNCPNCNKVLKVKIKDEEKVVCEYCSYVLSKKIEKWFLGSKRTFNRGMFHILRTIYEHYKKTRYGRRPNFLSMQEINSLPGMEYIEMNHIYILGKWGLLKQKYGIKGQPWCISQIGIKFMEGLIKIPKEIIEKKDADTIFSENLIHVTDKMDEFWKKHEDYRNDILISLEYIKNKDFDKANFLIDKTLN